LNDYLYVPGRNPAQAQAARKAEVRVVDPGPLVATLAIESDAPGARRLARELRVYHGLDRLDISDLIDKIPVRENESVHIAFPFQVAGGETRVDIGWAIVRPDADQIAGSCKDFFGAQAVDISNAGMGVTWVAVDAPLVELGRMTDESAREKGVRRWRTEVGPAQALYSYAMNNYWHTNYKADQEGPVTLRYAIRPHGAYDAAEVVRFALERTRPLLVAASDGSAPLPDPPVRVASKTAVATSLMPVDPDDPREMLLRLYNPSAEEAEVVLSPISPGPGPADGRRPPGLRARARAPAYRLRPRRDGLPGARAGQCRQRPGQGRGLLPLPPDAVLPPGRLAGREHRRGCPRFRRWPARVRVQPRA